MLQAKNSEPQAKHLESQAKLLNLNTIILNESQAKNHELHAKHPISQVPTESTHESEKASIDSCLTVALFNIIILTSIFFRD